MTCAPDAFNAASYEFDAGLIVLVSFISPFENERRLAREIAGDIPRYLDPLDGQGWEAAIRAYCGDAPDRARQLAAMPSFRAPSWDDHFAKVDGWLATL